MSDLRTVPVESDYSCIVFIHPQRPLLGRRVILEARPYLIGRSGAADIQIDRTAISRRHARLRFMNGTWCIEDLSSKNGTLVDGVRIKGSQQLEDGATVQVGDTLFRFLSGKNIEALYHFEIYKLSLQDGLTELGNQRFFHEVLEREAALVARYGHSLSLLLVDIDNFKTINDSKGHDIGDLVLQAFVSYIRPRIRSGDIFARCGGDEFAIILPHTELTGALELAESIRKIVEGRPVDTTAGSVSLTLSIGISTSAKDEVFAASALFKKADQNLYRAKSEGRNRVIG